MRKNEVDLAPFVGCVDGVRYSVDDHGWEVYSIARREHCAALRANLPPEFAELAWDASLEEAAL